MSDTKDDALFMQRALELAALGNGTVAPNPMVGCVVVYEGQIIGEGFHQKFGGPHAEVHAITSVQNKALLSASTVYVTLEPCAHTGKTPPCADLLVQHQVKEVVICNLDPNPKVAGKGVAILKNAGIHVRVGILEGVGLQLNRVFFTFHSKKRPYVILKWAETKDKLIAKENFDSKWISGPCSRQLVHQWRAQTAAIMVGINTAKQDNPTLTTRDWPGKNPIRLLFDPNLRLEQNAKILDQSVETYVFSFVPSTAPHTIQVDPASPERDILNFLYTKGVDSLFIEGGTRTIQSFINAGLWDEARVFTGNVFFKKGINAPNIALTPSNTSAIQKDLLHIYFNNR